MEHLVVNSALNVKKRVAQPVASTQLALATVTRHLQPQAQVHIVAMMNVQFAHTAVTEQQDLILVRPKQHLADKTVHQDVTLQPDAIRMQDIF